MNITYPLNCAEIPSGRRGTDRTRLQAVLRYDSYRLRSVADNIFRQGIFKVAKIAVGSAFGQCMLNPRGHFFGRSGGKNIHPT
jgi:hypothetical protein